LTSGAELRTPQDAAIADDGKPRICHRSAKEAMAMDGIAYEQSEAVLLNMLPDELLQLADVCLFLRLVFTPKCLKLGMIRRIGDVLVVPPQAIQPPTQVVNEIVVMVSHSAGLAEMHVFRVCCDGHG
jgi:hypothetical protein